MIFKRGSTSYHHSLFTFPSRVNIVLKERKEKWISSICKTLSMSSETDNIFLKSIAKDKKISYNVRYSNISTD